MGLYRRGKIWWIKLQRGGRTFRRSTGTAHRTKALKAEREFREEIEARREGGGRTFDELMERFIHEHLSVIRPAAAVRYMTSIRRLTPHLTGLALAGITRKDVSAFVSARMKGENGKKPKPATIRRDLACGSIAFSLGMEWEWTDHNPFRDYRKKSLPQATPRTRALSEDERNAVYRAATVGREVMKAAWLTGMRSGELCNLRRSDVDFDRGEILVRDSKNKRPRVVPLDDEGLAHFRRQKMATGTPWMFWWGEGQPYRVRQISVAFNRAARKAKVRDARFHDLRHTFASDRINRGMALFTLGRILGHSTPAMTAKYAHLDLEAMKEAMRRTQRSQGTGQATEVTDFSLEGDNENG